MGLKEKLEKYRDTKATDFATAPLGFSGAESLDEKERDDFKAGADLFLPLLLEAVEELEQIPTFRGPNCMVDMVVTAQDAVRKIEEKVGQK